MVFNARICLWTIPDAVIWSRCDSEDPKSGVKQLIVKIAAYFIYSQSVLDSFGSYMCSLWWWNVASDVMLANKSWLLVSGICLSVRPVVFLCYLPPPLWRVVMILLSYCYTILDGTYVAQKLRKTTYRARVFQYFVSLASSIQFTDACEAFLQLF